MFFFFFQKHEKSLSLTHMNYIYTCTYASLMNNTQTLDNF